MAERDDVASLHLLLPLARELARVAAESVATLCDPANRRFWRNTGGMESPSPAGRVAEFPTVSLACSTALLHSAHFFRTNQSAEMQAALAVARSIPEQYGIAELESSSLVEGERALSPFTVAQYLQCLAELSKTEPDLARERFNEIMPELAEHSSAPLYLGEGAPTTHPFIIFHLLRAAISCEESFGSNPELAAVKALAPTLLSGTARRIISSHVLESASPDEYIALAFCGFGLASGPIAFDGALAALAISIAAGAQDASGCWALGRIVENDKGSGHTDRIEISTYEISWAMATAVRMLIRLESLGNALDSAAVFTALGSALSYARRSVTTVEIEGKRVDGWCSDHPYGRPIIESWTSATVLHAAMEFQILIESWESKMTLQRFDHVLPTDDDWPGWLRWSDYIDAGEVDHEHPILAYLDRHLVQPIRQSSAGFPSAESSTVSALLFGPPGTSKTTIVKAVADGLGWPLVQLNPGVFIERGLELIEAQARSVFEDLRKLRRAVVLFDECDELFRERTPAGATEQVRSITAFVTASMLPKLQDLHDLGHVVFFICTNNFDALDAAVKRRGRIDHILGVGPPDEAARKKIVLQALDVHAKKEPPGAARLYQGTNRFSRGELIYLIRQFAQMRQGVEGDEELAKVLIDDMEPSLNITESSYSNFRTQLAASSAAHISKG